MTKSKNNTTNVKAKKIIKITNYKTINNQSNFIYIANTIQNCLQFHLKTKTAKQIKLKWALQQMNK